ncbi:hypothetical protein D6745_05255 [Candidatus Woesearchaeota archaeon]|nr:MAG: hypothetical protein D6745_05255 [Candidatus Woesearchaeota archaeon]
MKVVKNLIILSVIIFLVFPSVLAKDITLSLDQKEYYFLTGENAIIKLNADNTYKETINGMLSYTITQSINQGNFQYSSSSTKSTTLSIEKGETEIPLSFGTSDTPLTLDVSLTFSYTKDEAREVNLDGIKIHFVSDESQKKNEQNKVSSSSQKASQTPQSNPFAQQEQRMQQMMNQVFGSQQPKQQQPAEQRLQNNQLSQDSSALKQQMQQQLEEQQRMKEQFQKEIAKNEEFQKQHQELLDKGYNLTGASINPSSNNSGSFEMNYKNQKGETASLKGEMQNGVMKSFQKDTPEARSQMLEQLQKNKQFQQYQKQLEQQGFSQKNAEFEYGSNTTTVKMNYVNKNNETAFIKAEIGNNTVEKVELVNENEKKGKNYWRLLIIIIMVALLGYFLYKKLAKKPKPEEDDTVEKEQEKEFDHTAESLKMLEEAKKLFEKKQYKDAYGRAAQALRLYLSYENGLKKELTNDDMISYLKKHNKSYKDVKECFDLCSLVEFAKYQANKKDFDMIIRHAEMIIRKKS